MTAGKRGRKQFGPDLVCGRVPGRIYIICIGTEGVMKIIMLGAPGAGKGTQAKRIAESRGIPHISTGDIFRANIKAGTELGRKAKAFIDQGALVPDDVTIGMLMDRIHEVDCAGGYILDGFPRTIPQAESLTEALKAEGQSVDAAVNIEVPDEIIIRRMSGRRVCTGCGAPYHIEYHPPRTEAVCDSCGSALILRADDSPGTVGRRLAVYHEQTQPLIAYYGAAGVLKTVDGTRSMDQVFADIRAVL